MIRYDASPVRLAARVLVCLPASCLPFCLSTRLPVYVSVWLCLVCLVPHDPGSNKKDTVHACGQLEMLVDRENLLVQVYNIYVVMPYIVLAHIVIAHKVIAHIVMTYIVLAHIATAYMTVVGPYNLAHKVTAHIVMTYIVLAYIATAYITMAGRTSWCTRTPN